MTPDELNRLWQNGDVDAGRELAERWRDHDLDSVEQTALRRTVQAFVHAGTLPLARPLLNVIESESIAGDLNAEQFLTDALTDVTSRTDFADGGCDRLADRLRTWSSAKDAREVLLRVFASAPQNWPDMQDVLVSGWKQTEPQSRSSSLAQQFVTVLANAEVNEATATALAPMLNSWASDDSAPRRLMGEWPAAARWMGLLPHAETNSATAALCERLTRTGLQGRDVRATWAFWNALVQAADTHGELLRNAEANARQAAHATEPISLGPVTLNGVVAGLTHLDSNEQPLPIARECAGILARRLNEVTHHSDLSENGGRRISMSVDVREACSAQLQRLNRDLIQQHTSLRQLQDACADHARDSAHSQLQALVATFDSQTGSQHPDPQTRAGMPVVLQTRADELREQYLTALQSREDNPEKAASRHMQIVVAQTVADLFFAADSETRRSFLRHDSNVDEVLDRALDAVTPGRPIEEFLRYDDFVAVAQTSNLANNVGGTPPVALESHGDIAWGVLREEIRALLVQKMSQA